MTAPTRPAHKQPSAGSNRAFRGLALVFVLSFANLAGVIVTVAALGGLGAWTRWQFIGLFGAIEAASGAANVISPNLWRLPVAALETSERTEVKLASSVLLLPHWGGLARSAAGFVCLAVAGWHEGVGTASAALVPFLAALAWSLVAVSAVFARAGVARPGIDVVQFVVRWGYREKELPPISIGASILQFLLSILTIPAVKMLEPSVLYQPEIGPSQRTLLVTLVISLGLAGAVWLLWFGRIGRAAPPEQQREAEEQA